MADPKRTDSEATANRYRRTLIGRTQMRLAERVAYIAADSLRESVGSCELRPRNLRVRAGIPKRRLLFSFSQKVAHEDSNSRISGTEGFVRICNLTNPKIGP